MKLILPNMKKLKMGIMKITILFYCPEPNWISVLLLDPVLWGYYRFCGWDCWLIYRPGWREAVLVSHSIFRWDKTHRDTYTYIHTYIQTHIHIHINTYTDTYRHRHIQTHTYRHRQTDAETYACRIHSRAPTQ